MVKVPQNWRATPRRRGLHAHHLSFSATDTTKNTLPCWLATLSETQHSMTLYLKLNQPPHNSEDYHLQAEILKDKWFEIKEHSFPWYVRLNKIQFFCA